jgi:two-component system C4-dicarboxylate transport sensor histidine kinase DctB
METEKIGQLYRLAEFGRLSSGVFHDLINPLTAVSLNLEQIKNENEASLINAKGCLSQAISASHKMEDLIICIKKSIRQENSKINFFPKAEIEAVVNILGYKSRKANTEVHFCCEDETAFYGDPVKFSQVIINLISNSIDSCQSKKENSTQIIKVNLKRQKELMVIEVKDCGIGIPPENINKVFQPFFSTKKEGGLGLGLSSTKNIIEKEFSGSISVSSEVDKETIFTVTIPLIYAA